MTENTNGPGEQERTRLLLDKAGLWAILHVTFFSLAHPALVWLLARWLTISELAAFATAWIVLVLLVQLQSTLTVRLPDWNKSRPPVLTTEDIRHQLRHHVGLAALLTIFMVAIIGGLMLVMPEGSAARTTLYSLLAFALFWPTISLIILPRRVALYIGRVDLSARLSINYFWTSIALAGLLQALNLLTAVSAFLSLATAAFLTAWPALRRDWLYRLTAEAPAPAQPSSSSSPVFTRQRLRYLIPSLTNWAMTCFPVFVLSLSGPVYDAALFFLLLGLVAPLQAFMKVIERLHHAEPGKTALQSELHKPAILVSVLTGIVLYALTGIYLDDLNSVVFLNHFDSGLSLYWIAGAAILLSGLVALLSRGKRQRDPDYGTTDTKSHAVVRIAFITGSVLASVYFGPLGAVTLILLWQIWRLLRVTIFEWSWSGTKVAGT